MITLIVVCSLFIIGLHYSFQFDLTQKELPKMTEKEIYESVERFNKIQREHNINYIIDDDEIANIKKTHSSESPPIIETSIINKEILWFIKYYLHVMFNKTRFKWVLKPLCDCPVCMASVYCTIIYWGRTYFCIDEITLITFIKWPVLVAAVAGLNRVLWKFLVS